METNRVQSDSDLEKGSIKNEQKSTNPDPVPTNTNEAKKLKLTLKDDNELKQENALSWIFNILSKI